MKQKVKGSRQKRRALAVDAGHQSGEHCYWETSCLVCSHTLESRTEWAFSISLSTRTHISPHTGTQTDTGGRGGLLRNREPRLTSKEELTSLTPSPSLSTWSSLLFSQVTEQSVRQESQPFIPALLLTTWPYGSERLSDLIKTSQTINGGSLVSIPVETDT